MNSMDAMDLGNCRDTALAAGEDIDRIKDALEADGSSLTKSALSAASRRSRQRPATNRSQRVTPF